MVRARRAIQRDFQTPDRTRRARAPVCPHRGKEWSGSVRGGHHDDSCWYKWGGVNLASPLPHSHRAVWGIAGQRETWLPWALGLIQGSRCLWREVSEDRPTLGGAGLMRAGGARPTCVVHDTCLPLLGECPSCKKT